MNAPQNNIWGPNLWILLHSMAEKCGTSPNGKLPQEETRLWSGLLSSLRFSLPCPLCKRHFTAYYQSNPIHDVSKEFVAVGNVLHRAVDLEELFSSGFYL